MSLSIAIKVSSDSERGNSDADKCRRNGWMVGTSLVGDEGYGPTVIEITAIGEKSILAKTISHNGQPPKYGSDEAVWTLSCRDWKLVPTP